MPSNSNPFDLSSFEQFFGGKLPILGAAGKEHFGWIEDYVKEALVNALPNAAQASASSVRAETFETHHYVVVKCKVPEGMNLEELHIQASADQVKLEGLPKGTTQYIRLPSSVDPRQCRALLKNSVLQIKLKKRRQGQRFHDVYLRQD